MKRLFFIFISLALFFGGITSALALEAADVMKKAHLAAYYAGNDGSAQLLMKVYAKGSDKPIKKMFYMLKLDVEEGGKQMFFTYFIKPTDIKRTTFLVHKNVGEDDYRRLYIPASDKVLAIAGSRNQDPFMGSDFSYEDVSGRHWTKDNHKLMDSQMISGMDTYVVESTPKVKEEKISKIKFWVIKSNYIPVKVEFFNQDGKLFKRYESDNIKDIDGFPTIMKRVMTSPIDGTKTIIMANPKKVRYNIGLTENIFSERSLKKPPIKFLK